MTLPGIAIPSWEAQRAASVGWIVSTALYALFAAMVFIAHGAAPSLNVDHVSYFRLADDIVNFRPDGDYWRVTRQITSYGVVLAYLQAWTGAHILSMKLLLSLFTVLSMLAFELFVGLATRDKWKAVLFTLLSGFFVSFGASIWGYTDFSASLNRTVLIPFMLVAIWVWVRAGEHPVKFVVFPVLTACSLAHLSAYYAIGVLALAEGWDWGWRRRFSFDRRLAWFLAGLFAAALVREIYKLLGVDNTIDLHGLIGDRLAYTMLPPAQAWTYELMAYPWRNMPLPAGTLANIGLSCGVILALAAAGALSVWRRGEANELDRHMLVLAGAIVFFAYALQTLLWIARQFLPVYPFSIEEVRTINLIMIPSLYFIFRLYDRLWSARKRGWAALVVGATLLQPILVLQAAPQVARQAVFDAALDAGLIRADDRLRVAYARQLLGLEQGGPRFYYSAEGVMHWLAENTRRGEPVVSNLNELLVVQVRVIGSFNGILGRPTAHPERASWASDVQEVELAFAARDLEAVRTIARGRGARLAVVPWQVPDAAYRDQHYSIVRVEG